MDLTDLEPYARSLYNKSLSILADVETWETTTSIHGLDKFKSVVKAEAKFLEKVDAFSGGILRKPNIVTLKLTLSCTNPHHQILDSPDTIKKEHVQSSNVFYLDGVRTTIHSSANVVSVFKNFSFTQSLAQTANSSRRKWSVKVDVVADGGMRWYKVNARNVRALRHDLAGFEEDDSDSEQDLESDGINMSNEKGNKATDFPSVDTFSLDGLPVLRQARDFLAAAQQHPVHFRVPAITFRFNSITRGEDKFVDEYIVRRLEALGVVVEMAREGAFDTTTLSTSALVLPNLTTTLNLDLTTLIALISQLSHTPFPQPALFTSRECLQIQARQELARPILSHLSRLFQNRMLYTTTSARQKLFSILSVDGGSCERARALILFRDPSTVLTPSDLALWSHYPTNAPPLVQTLPDSPSVRFQDLLLRRDSGSKRAIGAKFNEFHMAIFGTGDAARMTTVTAIMWIERSLSDAGVTGVAIETHESRSLTEKKIGGWEGAANGGRGRGRGRGRERGREREGSGGRDEEVLEEMANEGVNQRVEADLGADVSESTVTDETSGDTNDIANALVDTRLARDYANSSNV